MVNSVRDSDVKCRIVTAAHRVVASQGVHASTMRGIAAEAGVTTGAVTHYFADKADVMAAVLEYNNRLATERVTERVAGRRGLAALAATVEALVPSDELSLQAWTVLVAFWGHAPAQPVLDAWVTEATSGARGLRSWLGKTLGDAVELGELDAGVDIDHETERALVLIAGLGVMAGGFPQELEQVRRRTKAMLADYLDQLKQR
ncbi:TetR/AcrR family transcriptional regulator [Haloechinothrix sp. LS1_15]|uniref:TetR/AcrR family transcriptional regulator n=1 Tax=Haloechinothrix sp. LS1_15 TaxID=2652248 RepID=UPI00294B84CC|nr:TetR/AcrR family transcriptional regulator [Haloechinothrix sp. LS1_15]